MRFQGFAAGLAILGTVAAVCILGIWVQNLKADRDWMQRDIGSLNKALEYIQTQVNDLQHRMKTP